MRVQPRVRHFVRFILLKAMFLAESIVILLQLIKDITLYTLSANYLRFVQPSIRETHVDS